MGSGLVGPDTWDDLKRHCRQQSTLVAHKAQALTGPHLGAVSWAAEQTSHDDAAEPRPEAPLAGVTALVLDCDNVLFDATLWRRWVLNLLARMGVATHYQAFFHVWDCEFYHAVCRGEREFQEAFVAFLQSAGLARASAQELAAASWKRQTELEETSRPLAGVTATLARLNKAGIRLGLLSNSPQTGDVIAAQLARVGLGATIEHVVSSRDLGLTKPDRAAYVAMLERLERSPRETAFVGHDTAELAGAAAVGLRTVAFNYRRGAVAEVYLQRFEQLASVVG